MIWHLSNRADPRARDIADRHYNRQKPGTPQFVPPGRCCVLYTETDSGKALWVTSYPFAEYVKHQWAGAWIFQKRRSWNRLGNDTRSRSRHQGILRGTARAWNDNLHQHKESSSNEAPRKGYMGPDIRKGWFSPCRKNKERASGLPTASKGYASSRKGIRANKGGSQ